MSERSETESERDLDNIEVGDEADDSDDDVDDLRSCQNPMRPPVRDPPSGAGPGVWATEQSPPQRPIR